MPCGFFTRDEIVAVIHMEKHPICAPPAVTPTPPTDEDVREGLACDLLGVKRIPLDPQWPRHADALELADTALAWMEREGFRRQAVSTPEAEWEYGIRIIGTSKWAPTTAEHVAKVQAWHNGTYEFARRTAPGDWQPLPTEGEA